MSSRRKNTGGEITSRRASEVMRTRRLATGLVGTALVALLLPCACDAGEGADPGSSATERLSDPTAGERATDSALDPRTAGERVQTLPMVEDAEGRRPESNNRLARRKKGPSWYHTDDSAAQVQQSQGHGKGTAEENKGKKKLKKANRKVKRKVVSPD
jgi:hypothetical protein